MTTPYFVEDSTPLELAPILSRTIEKLDDTADKFDYIMAFFIALMTEKTYRVSCLYDEIKGEWSKDMTAIPKETWKIPGTNIYEIKFLLYTRKDIGIKLIGFPIGDWMVLNLTFSGQSRLCKARAMTVTVTKYVILSSNLGKLWNVKELALQFKNDLLDPLHGEIMMEIGVAGPSLQGLPEEIKSTIAGQLDPWSRKNLEKVCQDFQT